MSAAYDFELLVSSLEKLDTSSGDGEFAYVPEDGRMRDEDSR